MPKVVYNTWLVPRGFRAWVISPFMLFSHKKEEVSDTLFRHELEHIYQVDREGWFRFYIKYIWYSIRLGYLNNPYEVEARSKEGLPLTTVERFWKDG